MRFRRTYSILPVLLGGMVSAIAQAQPRDCQPPVIDSVITNSPLCPGSSACFSLHTGGQVFGYAWEGPGTGTYFSLAPSFSFPDQVLGEYTIIAYGLCGRDTVRATVTAEGAGAGQDNSVHLCDYAPPFTLASALGAHDEGGTWTFNGGPHGGYYDPATDQPGEYVYTAPFPATCPGTSQTAAILVAETVVGQGRALAICAADSAFSLALALDTNATPGGQWFRHVFLSLEPHGDTYDPVIDSSGTFRYTVNGCFVSVTVDEAPLLPWFEDLDGDGLGDPATLFRSCGQPPGHVADSTDNCPLLPGRIGDPCDDGLPGTVDDVITDGCTCEGVIHTGVADGTEGGPAFRLWPNPGHGEQIHLECPDAGTARIRILDAVGRELLVLDADLSGAPLTIRMNGPWAPGLYVVQLTMGGHSSAKPLLVR